MTEFGAFVVKLWLVDYELNGCGMSKMVESFQTESTFYLVTEVCRPLSLYLEESELRNPQKDLLVSWGLYQVLVSHFQ